MTDVPKEISAQLGDPQVMIFKSLSLCICMYKCMIYVEARGLPRMPFLKFHLLFVRLSI